jgi:hypothetical protein
MYIYIYIYAQMYTHAQYKRHINAYAYNACLSGFDILPVYVVIEYLEYASVTLLNGFESF